MPAESFTDLLMEAHKQAFEDAKKTREDCAQAGWKHRGDIAELKMRELALKQAEAQVKQLSRFPRRLFASSEEKIKAMQNLMLKRVELHGYSWRLQELEKTNPSPDGPEKQELSTREVVPRAVPELENDKYRLRALFSRKALKSPAVNELDQIAKGEQRRAYGTVDEKEVQDEVGAAQKEVAGFKRHFRSKAGDEEARERLLKAQQALADLNKPPNIEELNRRFEVAQQQFNDKQAKVDAAMAQVPPGEKAGKKLGLGPLLRERDKAGKELDAAQKALQLARKEQFLPPPSVADAPAAPPITHALTKQNTTQAAGQRAAEAPTAEPTEPEKTTTTPRPGGGGGRG